MQGIKNKNNNNRQNSKFTYICENIQEFESFQNNQFQNWKLITV